VSLNREPVPAATGLTQAVDILAFVEAQEIPSHYFETPYYLAPAPGGEQEYALLRETLRRTGKVGIAYVVIQARQHLAALIPHGQSLVLNTLRWNSEAREATLIAGAAAAAGPIRVGSAAPLQRMRVTGCDDLENDQMDELLEDSVFDSEDLLCMFLRPRLHAPVPRAGRSTTVRQPLGALRPRRLARRA
jgi:hypothetical protein